MPTSYPSGFDDFHVTTDPANTSLSQPGQNSDGRNHVQAHTDLGDAIEALQTYAALRSHDHSGSSSDRTKGPKLSQANTHEGADTNTSLTAIHHTLTDILPVNGTTDQYKAAPGNHTHEYATLNSTPLRRCTSTTRPTAITEAPLGTLIYETNTGLVRQLRSTSGGNTWVLTPVGPTPVIRLRQSVNQTISGAGTVMQWNEEVEDNFGWFAAAGSSPWTTTITIGESGLYHFEAAIQWSSGVVPENGIVVVTVNGADSDLRNSAYQKPAGLGILFPSFQQTLPLSGNIRLTAGDQVALKCSHNAGSLLGTILSFFDAGSQVKSRLDVTYVSP